MSATCRSKALVRSARGSWSCQPRFVSLTTARSDVILHLRYTALDGGAELKDCVESGQRELLNEMMLAANRNGLFQAYNLRQQFPNEWARLKQRTLHS